MIASSGECMAMSWLARRGGVSMNTASSLGSSSGRRTIFDRSSEERKTGASASLTIFAEGVQLHPLTGDRRARA
jgi:hypothetical protein